MNLEDVFTSAAINIGLAIIFIFLFSILSKQEGNAGVYYTRDLLKHRNDKQSNERRTLASFIPSVGWLLRAWRTTEKELQDSAGLDAVVFLRIFIFSIRLFSACAFIGLFILVPTTFSAKQGSSEDKWREQDFDKFSISNISTGSKRLWVHFFAVYVISIIVYVMSFLEYNNVAKMRLKYLFERQPQPDQFSALVRAIPKDPGGGSYSDSVYEFFSRYHSESYLSHQMVYNASGLDSKIEKLELTKKEITWLREKPERKRQPKRTGWCGLYGQRMDPIELKTKELEKLYHQIQAGQQEVLHHKKETPAAIVSFKSRWSASVTAQSQLADNPVTWVAEWAPEPRDLYWKNLFMTTFQTFFRQFIAGVVVFAITVFYCIPSAAIVAINGIDDLADLLKLPPKVIDILKLPGLRQFISGYLATVLLAALLYAIPGVFLFLSRLEGFSSMSIMERKTCEKYFYFLAGPIFFIQVLGGGAVEVASEWEFFQKPIEIPFRLASHIPGQATFFMSYVMTTGWAGFPLELLNTGTLLLNFFKRHTVNENPSQPSLEIYSLQYYRAIPNVLIFLFVGIIYSAIAPLLTPFILVYFAMGYLIYKNQILHVYEKAYETAGQYWPTVHSRIMAGLSVMQITFIGIFGVKLGTRVSLMTAPLLVVTFLFHLYCGKRFKPIFERMAMETAKKKDMDDEHKGLQEKNMEIIPDSYLHPGLRPVDISGFGSSENERLLSSDSQA